MPAEKEIMKIINANLFKDGNQIKEIEEGGGERKYVLLDANPENLTDYTKKEFDSHSTDIKAFIIQKVLSICEMRIKANQKTSSFLISEIKKTFTRKTTQVERNA